jgi:tetratricopeptide (TPR) repeat protein
MRKYFIAAYLFAALLAVVPLAGAQSALLDLPRASQRAVVSQRIGITGITIRYHRPLANGRKIFGGLEPMGKPWRAGANENTTIEFGDAVTVEGQPLAKGTYGLHMIPGETDWVVIFSKNSGSWGSFSYDQAEDALRVNVKSHPDEFHNALTYDFDDLKPNSTVVTMRWDKVAVPFKVEANVNDAVQLSLRNQLRGRAQYEWQAWEEAAEYYLDNKLSAEDALKFADHSVQIEDRFENQISRYRALTLLNRNDEATAATKRAFAIGSANQIHGLGRQLQQQGKQDQAFEVFRANIKKNPDHWTAHSELARIACSTGDFDTAVKEMKLAVAVAPDQIKAPLDGLAKRLEQKQDINK